MKEYRKIPSLKFMYEINEHGEIRNVKSKRVLKWNIHHKNGRAAVNIRMQRRTLSPLIHRLVAEVWLKEWNPELTVDHIDNDCLNNHVSNLQMMTKAENYRKAYEDGRIRGNLIPEQKVVMFNPRDKIKTIFNGALEAASYIKQNYPEYEGSEKNLRNRILTHCKGIRKGMAYKHKWAYYKPVETIPTGSRALSDKVLEKDVA